MSNSFDISVHPEIAALAAQIVIVDTVVDAIRAVDIPNVQTNIDANETILNAVKLKTDLLPPTLPKCKPYQVTGTGNSAAYVELINVTGAGIFYNAFWRATDNTTAVDIKITIDGLVEEFTGLQTLDYIQILRESVYDSDFLFFMWDTADAAPSNILNELNIEFSTGLKVEYRRSAGAFDIFWHLVYGVV